MVKKSDKRKNVKVGEGDAALEVRRRIGEYALLHFAGVCEDAGGLAESLIDDEVTMKLLPYDPDHRRELLIDNITNRLDYIADGLAELRAAGLLPGRENQVAPDTGQGEKSQQTQN